MIERWSFMDREGQEQLDAQEAEVELLQWLLACLRAQYWSYQESHWQVRGRTFYGDHLLFQRLYESVQAQVDTLAEKMVGLYGEEAVDGLDVGAKFESWIRRWADTDCLHKRGLLSEQDFQNTCKSVYENLGKLGALSLGMDDFLMATANEHETNEYLLRQLLRSKESAKMAADDWATLSSKE